MFDTVKVEEVLSNSKEVEGGTLDSAPGLGGLNCCVVCAWLYRSDFVCGCEVCCVAVSRSRDYGVHF